MIAASAIFVVVAFITLIIGIFQTGLGLIWVSIASSVLAAIFLLLGVLRGRPTASTTAESGALPGTWADEADAPVVLPEPDETAATIALDAPARADEPVVEPAPVSTPRRAASTTRAAARQTARPAAERSSRASTAGRPVRAPAASVSVVVIPDRDKFHKESCRYAKAAGTMRMTKSEARREGYKACGICKP